MDLSVSLVTHNNLPRKRLVRHLENYPHLSATAMVMARRRDSRASLLCQEEQSQKLHYGMREWAEVKPIIVGEKQMLICNRMGELEPWIDENFVRSVWFGMGEQVNVKMIRDKFSGYVSLQCCVGSWRSRR